jgi:hypothetical protein
VAIHLIIFRERLEKRSCRSRAPNHLYLSLQLYLSLHHIKPCELNDTSNSIFFFLFGADGEWTQIEYTGW